MDVELAEWSSARADAVAGSNISVIIQGPLIKRIGDGGIDGAIRSIETILPKAEVIISTWDTEDLTGFGGYKNLTSPDPGALVDVTGKICNINRQIVSTLAGLRLASRPFALKFRADLVLTGTRFFEFHGDSAPDCPDLRLLAGRITMSNRFVLCPERVPYLFHFSDIVQFGRTDDLLDFWDQPLFSREQVTRPRVDINPIGNFTGWNAFRAAPEQLLVLGWLQKHGVHVELPHHADTSFAHFQLHERLLATAFHVVDWQESDISFPSRFQFPFFSDQPLYTVREVAAMASGLDGWSQRLRFARVLLRKYVYCWFKLFWIKVMLDAVLRARAPWAHAAIRRFREKRFSVGDSC